MGNLGCFQFVAIMKNDAITNHMRAFDMSQLLLGRVLAEQLLGCAVSSVS